MRPFLLLRLPLSAGATQPLAHGRLPREGHFLQKRLQLFSWIIRRAQRVQGLVFQTHWPPRPQKELANGTRCRLRAQVLPDHVKNNNFAGDYEMRSCFSSTLRYWIRATSAARE